MLRSSASAGMIQTSQSRGSVGTRAALCPLIPQSLLPAALGCSPGPGVQRHVALCGAQCPPPLRCGYKWPINSGSYLPSFRCHVCGHSLSSLGRVSLLRQWGEEEAVETLLPVMCYYCPRNFAKCRGKGTDQ